MLKVREIISPKQAKALIEDFSLYGNHLHTNRTNNLMRRDIPNFFKSRGISFHKLIKEARTFKKHIPCVENLLDVSEATYIADNENDCLYLEKNGKKHLVIQGSGKFYSSVYQAKFELACNARDRAIATCNVDEIYNAISLYITSFESFFSDISETYNYNMKRVILEDSKKNPVSLEYKIKEWLPLLSQGKKLDLSNKSWLYFKQFIVIRHDYSIHPKNFTNGMKYSEMAEMINKFSLAFGELFFEMHKLLNIRIFRALIRTKYFPEVYVVTEKLPKR